MSENPIPLEIEHADDLPDQEAEKKKERRDFRLGLIGNIVLNVALCTLFISSVLPLSYSTFQEDSAQIFLGLFQVSVSFLCGLDFLAIIVVLPMRRPAIAAGILASFALSIGIEIILGFIIIVITSIVSR